MSETSALPFQELQVFSMYRQMNEKLHQKGQAPILRGLMQRVPEEARRNDILRELE